MKNEERTLLLQTQKLNNQIYLACCDWANYHINAATTDVTKKGLVHAVLDNVQKVAYGVGVILISDPAITKYILPTKREETANSIQTSTVYELPDELVSSVVNSILSNKANWLLGG